MLSLEVVVKIDFHSKKERTRHKRVEIGTDAESETNLKFENVK